ncbi:hypothetical protein ALO_17800, partial [Acetonema longum DSM 6540]
RTADKMISSKVEVITIPRKVRHTKEKQGEVDRPIKNITGISRSQIARD